MRAAELLRAAADDYGAAGHESGPIHPWGPNWAPPDLSDPELRRDIAAHVRLAQAAETRAVERLEQALEKLQGA
ncbi:MAG: hypothetical protein HYU66_29480 [Armatimonadetes bacterium]|nr:hypothetical protein [Armatimonadota bacterium]